VTRVFDSLVGRYAPILVGVLLLFLLEPLLVERGGTSGWMNVLVLLLVVVSLRAVWTSRVLLALVGMLGAALVSLSVLESFSLVSGPAVLTDIIGASFLLVTSYGILFDIFNRDEITADTVYGASAVYMLLGLAFARLYLALLKLDPDAFAASELLLSQVDQLGWKASGLIHYYSLVTLTTIGYGDVTPVAPLARNLAAIEGIMGQLFIAAVVARLVSLYSHEPKETQ
jgi:voltage-gated potassium channel